MYAAASLPASADLDDEIKARCKVNALTQECVKEAETALLAKHAKLVKRQGNTLELFLANAKVKKLTDVYDKDREFDSINLLFFDYLKEVDQFLIKEQYYEGEGYQLVDRKTGWAQKLDEAPVLSPDRKHFVTVSICEAYCRYRMQIWRQEHGGWFEMVWSHTPYESWLTGSAKWLDNATIEITTQIASNPSKGNYHYVKQPRYLKLQPHGWILTDKS